MKNQFTDYPDLICQGNGGQILFATDDFFAVCENMILDSEPIWNPSTYTPEGKEMDGWETRRKRTLGHDWCIVKLGFSGCIKGFDADTAHFTGNNVPAISIQAASLPDNTVESILGERISKRGTKASKELLFKADSLESQNWKTILPFTKLSPGFAESRHHLLACVEDDSRYTHIRVNIYPDGGLARLRAYGVVVPDWHTITNGDFMSLGLGTKAIQWTNAHYGNPMRMIAPGRSTGMHDGWETARNPNRPSIYTLNPETGMIDMPGSESAVFLLGHACKSPYRIVIDTNHYKGNYPESCLLEYAPVSSSIPIDWKVLVNRIKLNAHEEHVLEQADIQVPSTDCIGWIKVTMYPDGGISRVRIFATKV